MIDVCDGRLNNIFEMYSNCLKLHIILTKKRLNYVMYVCFLWKGKRHLSTERNYTNKTKSGKLGHLILKTVPLEKKNKANKDA